MAAVRSVAVALVHGFTATSVDAAAAAAEAKADEDDRQTDRQAYQRPTVTACRLD